MSRAARSVGVALVAALLAGCGSTGASSTPDPEREWQVAADPDATTDEIVEAGGPVDVAVSPDGDLRLTTWRVDPEDDEGSSWGAWRLQDDRGDVVADGHFDQVQEQTAAIDVVAVGDGFLLHDYDSETWQHVDADGTLEPAPTSRARLAVRPGDVVLDAWSGEVWSARERRVQRLPRLPTGNPQGVAIDGSGTLHVLLPRRDGDDAVVASSAGGAGPWRRTTLPLPPGDVTGALATASDGSVVLTTLAADDDFGRPEAVHRLVPGARWTTIPVPTTVRLAEPTVDVLEPELVLSDGQRAYLGDSDGFDELALPTEDTQVLVAGGRLWALGWRSNGLWSSDDLGATWREVAR